MTHAASHMLGPLSFPEDGNAEPSTQEEDAEGVTCVLCSVAFDLDRNKTDFFKHLQVAHNLVVADINLICDLKSYVEYWRLRFSKASFTDVCTLVKSASETTSPQDGTSIQYYLLSDIIPEDKKLREDLQGERLRTILGTQQGERDDSTFSRGCLFCREHFEGNRAELFNHMAFDHHFSVGQPNNIVFANEFLDILEGKLDSFKCLYCDKTFKDRLILKEHMRKKMHKRLNPKNPIYDKFYVINYLELGKNWEAVKSEEEGEGGNLADLEKEDNWEDWQEDSGIGAVCLFCSVSAADIKTLETHMLSQHKFNLEQMKQGLNFYLQVKLINYIRRCVHQRACISCKESFQSRAALLDHMTSLGHMTQLPSRDDWDQPQYFFPTYENDSLLCELEDDENEDAGQSEKTPIIAEDAPVPTDSILSDQNILKGLQDS
ncbi:zinc finger protein 277-like [Asterias amurensis]|uniref:zinc finger protein 277-like n=1 Tax=Asterias amurensis TaxID=7602 RepID=UPI003AB37C18